MLATMGEAAVETILSETEVTRDWTDEDRLELCRLAALRTAVEVQVAAQFPEFFPGVVAPNDYEPPEPTTDDLPPDVLAQTSSCIAGTLPILVTAPHGGHRTHFGDHALAYRPEGRLRDGGTKEITQDTAAFVTEVVPSQALSILIDEVSRQYRTSQTRTHFELQTFLRFCEMRRLFPAGTPLLHLDIHGFKAISENEMYDLILGTGHRTTTGGLDVDQALHDFMRDCGYAVYLPTTEPSEGEYFAADHANTLVQRVSSLALQNAGSVQIEISSKFRSREALPLGKKLARDLGTFCIEWSKDMT